MRLEVRCPTSREAGERGGRVQAVQQARDTGQSTCLPACRGQDTVPAEVTHELGLNGWPGGGQVWGRSPR